MYIVKIHEMYIISINETMTKQSEQTKTESFCGGAEKAVFNGFRKSRFKIFLHFSSEEK